MKKVLIQKKEWKLVLSADKRIVLEWETIKKK